ncbi:DUF2642 domain-containing protein [Brevibacillus nitrificans]|uniref:DUF2642 domain-containing protein n=1 Tax=Brevibacillus nitrificans TaxID=651560 RepID=UPI002E1B40F2|nr:DUF2642 domain-containing protein [Brevibacillus nitrificans]
MTYLDSLVGKTVQLKISGPIDRLGILIDYGLDVVVIFDGVDYVYVPSGHIQNIRLVSPDNQISNPIYDPADPNNELSYRKILMESKGMFVQIFVAGNQSIHGYVTNVLSDYFSFFSPVHKTLFVPLFHLKWLIPYPENKTPYTLEREALPLSPASIKLARTFEEQLKKMEGKIVVFDMGNNTEKIGLLKGIENNIAELITADQKPLYWNIHHLKTVHFPNI